jgi:hypothetical protein
MTGEEGLAGMAWPYLPRVAGAAIARHVGGPTLTPRSPPDARTPCRPTGEERSDRNASDHMENDPMLTRQGTTKTTP